MAKDFDAWHACKKLTDSKYKGAFYREGEVWWCSIGLNIGNEQDGKGNKFQRPVVIVRGFNKNLFIGVPLTTRDKQNRFYFAIGKIAGRSSFAILSQARPLDTKRLIRKVGIIDYQTLHSVRDAIASVLHKRI